MRRWIVWCALMPAFAGPRDLIALPDGQTLYFRMKSGVVDDSWKRLVAPVDGGAVQITDAQYAVADVNDAETVFASSGYKSGRICGYASSGCNIAPTCSGGFQIVNSNIPATHFGGSGSNTLLRFHSAGKIAWIDQGPSCSRLTAGLELARGFYETSTLKPLGRSANSLANSTPGRRMIVDNKGALTIGGGKLAWIAVNGEAASVPHRLPVAEAVVDVTGCNIVYLEKDSRRAHWLDCADSGADEDLRFTAKQPALTPDGRMLAFVDTNGEVAVYDRATRAVASGLLPPGEVESLAIGGARTLFVSSKPNGILRMDLYTGEVSLLVPPLPEIQSVLVRTASAMDQAWCSFICYQPLEPLFYPSPGMRIEIRTSNAGLEGWQMNGVESNVFQIPYSASGRMAVNIAHPQHPALALRLNMLIQPVSFACLSMVRADTGAPVDAANPVAPGDVVRVFMTGLGSASQAEFQQPNPEAFAVENPPALLEPDAAEIVDFRLLPGYIGLQYADLRIHRSFRFSSLFSFALQAGCTPPLVVAQP